MCNVASRLTFTVAVVMIAASGCKHNPEMTPAQQALARADSLTMAGNYGAALEVFDTIDSIYADEIDIRRQVMKKRPMVIERECQVQLALVDSTFAAAESRRAELLPLMTRKQVQGFGDGYSVATAADAPNFYSHTGIQGRVTADGSFYIVSSLTGGPLCHHSITFVTSAGEATTEPVGFDGELNMRTAGGEVVTYFGQIPDAIGELAAAEALGDSPKASVIFHWQKGDRTITLTPDQIRGLATAWEFARNYQALRTLSLDRDRLIATRDLARSQQHAISTDSTTM